MFCFLAILPMKKSFFYCLGFLLTATVTESVQAQDIKAPEPEPVTALTNFQKYPSRVFIPMALSQSTLTGIISNLTPTHQRIENETHSREVVADIDIADVATSYSGNTITHRMRLTKGDGYVKVRAGCIHNGLFRYHGPMVRVDCDDIRGNADAIVSAVLEPNYKLATTARLGVEIDNVQCAQINVTGILRGGGWHDFEVNLSREIQQQLGRVDIRGEVYKVWEQARKPYKVQPGLYVLLDPQSIVYKDVVFTNERLETGVGLTFFATTGDSLESTAWRPSTPFPETITKVAAVPNDGISINMPINISYKALTDIMKPQIRGKVIARKDKKGKEKKYAEILDATLGGSTEPGYDVVLGLNLNVKKTIFKRDNVQLYLHAKVAYDSLRQTLYVADYKLDPKTTSVLYNTSVSALVNNVAYKPILKYMRYDIGSTLTQQKEKVNALLSTGSLIEGVNITGSVNQVSAKQITAQPQGLAILFLLDGHVDAQVVSVNIR